MGRVQGFMLILGRVGSLYLWVGLGRIKKTLQDFVLDSRPVDGRGANVQLT